MKAGVDETGHRLLYPVLGHQRRSFLLGLDSFCLPLRLGHPEGRAVSPLRLGFLEAGLCLPFRMGFAEGTAMSPPPRTGAP